MANKPAPGRRLPAWLPIAIATGLAAVVVVNWPSSAVELPPRPPLPASELRRLTDAEVLVRANDRLRWYITIDRRRMTGWRNLPEPARHLLMLSAVEGEVGLPKQRDFSGLGAVFTNGVMGFSGAELAEAYRAIGAQACATIATQADAADATVIAACSRRLIEASRQDDAHHRMVVWVREHADDLAAVWAKP